MIIHVNITDRQTHQKYSWEPHKMKKKIFFFFHVTYEPGKAQNEVLNDGEVVVVLGRVDDGLAQEAVLARIVVEEAPVHLVVPPQLVEGGARRHHQPQVEEGVLPVVEVLVARAELVHEGLGGRDKEGGGVLEGVGEVREGVGGVLK